MMTLEKIEKSIREKGDGEIGEIEKKAEEETKEIEKGIEAEVEKAHKAVIEKRKQELELVPRRILSNARMERKLQIDSKKAKAVQDAFEDAKKRILGMSDKRKEKILKNLAEDGKKYVREPVIYVDKKYSKLIKAEVKDIDDFGAIVENKDGSMRVDNTLDNLMLRMEPDLKARVGEILFGD